MPQMSPIGWLSLFIVFSMSFIIFNMMNYYCVTLKSPKSNTVDSKIQQSLTWKW